MSDPETHIAVIILTLNQADVTLNCLSHLVTEAGPRFSILVWDNGSEEDNSPLRQAFDDVLVHRSEINLGVAGGRNAAAQWAFREWAPTHLLFLDNDMEIESGFISALLAPFLVDPAVGQTQAKLRFMSDRKRLNDGGGCAINFRTGSTRPVGYGELDRGQHDAVRACVACGGAMMVRSDVFRELGGFDTVFNPFGPEDIDFSLRLREAGYSALFVPTAVAYHAVSHTIGKDYDAEYASNKVRHWRILLKRHASLIERLYFYSLTAPFLFLRAAVREIRRGNAGAVRGLIAGVFRYSTRSSINKS